MEYVAKVMQEKHGRTIVEHIFGTMDEAKSFLSKYLSRNKYAKSNYVTRITKTNYGTIITSWQFISNQWVCIG